MNYDIIFIFVTYIVYAIFLVSFIVYSKMGLNHLKNYGYVGDSCQKVRNIYIIVASMIGIVSAIFLIFL
jgi:hypothetical protein